MFDLSNKKALITGASGGIGHAIAKVLKAQGADVALSGTRVDALEKVKDDLGSGHVLPCALNDKDAVATLVDRAVDAMGGLDILVNNAGITRDGLAMRMKDDDWSDVLEVNLTAAFVLSRAALKPMMKGRFGRIINMSSVVGVTGNPGQVNYVASKAGMIGMTKAMAQEVASRGVTVNAIAPGFIATPMTDALNDAQREGILSRIPTGTLGSPQDIATACLYLASNEASYVTGQTLNVNGGMVMV